MTRRLPHLCVTGTFTACLVLGASSCSVLHPEPLQTVPSRDSQGASRLRLAQLAFGRQATFGVCAEPACPQVTAKTIATSAPAQQPVAQPVALRDAPPAAPAADPVVEPPPPPPADMVKPVALPSTKISVAATETPSHHIVVAFGFSSSKLTPASSAALAASIRYARASETIVISGRTDSVGDLQVNEAIALSRAMAVRDYLRDIAPDIAATIAIDAKGRCCFVASNADEQGRAKNRRVQVSFNGPRGA